MRTEPLFSDLEHDIFFNRGVASSQAYAREFDNKTPDKLPPAKARRRQEWLSRSLDEAMLKFIANAKKNDTLLCCFYEFRYLPVAKALKEAIDRGVNVQIIIDAKVNETVDKKGKKHESFPREDNLRMLKSARLPKKNVILREAKPDSIAHNKFMVLLKGKSEAPAEVWTGSTNVSEGGIHGQTNVGHWVRDKDIAAQFKAYWELLSEDPGPHDGDDNATVRSKNKELRDAVEALHDTPKSVGDVKPGITPIFSPRGGPGVLDMYAHMVDDAKKVSCITLAFGISEVFKDSPQGQCDQQPHCLLPAGEAGQAKPEEQERIRRAQRRQQRLQGMGLVLARSLVSMDQRDERQGAPAQHACELYSLEIPADGSLVEGSRRGDRLGQF